MIYTFMMLDKAGGSAMRPALRPAHRAYIGQVADRIAFAGGLLADDGETIVGSLLAIDFPDRAAASAWVREEPFTKAGLYASVQILAFRNRWPQRTGFPEE